MSERQIWKLSAQGSPGEAMRGDKYSGLILLQQICKITPESCNIQKEKDYNLLVQRARGTMGHLDVLEIKLPLIPTNRVNLEQCQLLHYQDWRDRDFFFFVKVILNNEAETLKNEENVCYLQTEKTNSVGKNKRAVLPTQLEKNEYEAVPQGCSVTPLHCKYYPMSREISSHCKKAQPLR